MSKLNIFLFLVLFISQHLWAQKSFRTMVFDSNIKTLQVGTHNQDFVLPIIELNGNDVIKISFDEMSHLSRSLSYKVVHCNADWTLSPLITNEYLQGFNTATIDDFKRSTTTSYLYTHYSFELPNNDMRFRLSGNYLVIVYEDNRDNEPLAYACFSVVEPKVGIDAKVRSNTDIEINNSLQQLDFDLLTGNYSIKNPQDELKIVVRQNNRIDNQVIDIKPTFIAASRLSYNNNRSLIFEGGSEYRRFDISSIYAAAYGVERFEYKSPGHEAFLLTDKINTSRIYQHDFDVNGKFLINYQEHMYDIDIEADYMMVHFELEAAQPFFEGLLYVSGEFNHNIFDSNSRIDYNNETRTYQKSILLKQGGYNYHYFLKSKSQQKASVRPVAGSFWQTGNEYSIYVYHRAWGERYDRLIAVKTIVSN